MTLFSKRPHAHLQTVLNKSLRRALPLFMAGSLSLSLFGLPAQATLEQTLAPYPDDTLALVSVDLDLGHWGYIISWLMSGKKSAAEPVQTSAEAKKNSGAAKSGQSAKPKADDGDAKADGKMDQLPPQLGELMHLLKDEFHFDLFWDGLLNLGSHLTIAYRPYPGTRGQMLFSLNLKSPDKVNELMEHFHAYVTRQGDYHTVVVDHFGPADIYTLSQKNGLPEDFNQLHLAISGQNLIGTLGPNDDLIKRMLYIQGVLPPESRFHLASQPLFEPIKNTLKDKAVWVYLDAQGGYQTAMMMGAPAAEREELGILSQVLTLNRGLGVGLDIDREGIKLESFVVPDYPNLTPAQADYLQALNRTPQHDLNGLLAQMPARPIVVTAGQGLDVALSKPLPFKLPLDDLPFTAEDVRKGLKSIFNIDYQSDLVPKLDGRYGFGLFEAAPAGGSPQAVLYLGVRDGQEASFDTLMQKQLQFNLTALQNLGNAGSSQTPVQENMMTLKTMVETYAVDHDGAYPANLDALSAEARQQGYWQDVSNPVTGKSGIGAALKDFAGLNGRPDVNLAGIVFYSPKGDAGDYEIIGYDPAGKLYSINRDSGDFKTELDGLPKAEVPAPKAVLVAPKQIESYQGIPIYTLALDLKGQLPAELPADVQPVYARKGNVWMLAINPAALKAAIDGKKPERLDYWMTQTDTQAASALFYLDIAATGEALKGVLPQLIDKPEEIEAITAALKPWHALFATATREPRGTAGQFVIDADLDKVSLEPLLNLFKAGGSSLKPEDMPKAEKPVKKHRSGH